MSDVPETVDDIISDINRLLKEGEQKRERGRRVIENAAVFYAAAGVRLAKLKERMPPGEKWPAYVKAKCGLRRSRADELIKYGLHEDDVEKMLERTRASVKKHRAAKAAVICNGNGRDKFLAFASKMIESGRLPRREC